MQFVNICYSFILKAAMLEKTNNLTNKWRKWITVQIKPVDFLVMPNKQKYGPFAHLISILIVLLI